MRSTSPMYLLYVDTITGHGTVSLSLVPFCFLSTTFESSGVDGKKLVSSRTVLLSFHLTHEMPLAEHVFTSLRFMSRSVDKFLGICFLSERTVPRRYTLLFSISI